MNEMSDHLNKSDQLKAENDFLKLKIMIEQGGQFYSGNPDEQLPLEIENEFLNKIIEFERQFASRGRVKVFDKIGRPQFFRSVNEIENGELGEAWSTLSEYMRDHGIELTACSPRVNARELYRFATEELFMCETDDINIPGLITGFIYDEFYPDHEYDNSDTALNDCICAIFCKEPFEWMHCFDERVCLNERFFLTKEQLQNRITRFKDAYDEIKLHQAASEKSEINHGCCLVTGSYTATGRFGNDYANWSGKWLVEFTSRDEGNAWYIQRVKVEGIAF